MCPPRWKIPPYLWIGFDAIWCQKRFVANVAPARDNPARDASPRGSTRSKPAQDRHGLHEWARRPRRGGLGRVAVEANGSSGGRYDRHHRNIDFILKYSREDAKGERTL